MTYLAAPDRYDAMTYPRCGRSGIRLAAISLGLRRDERVTSMLVRASSVAHVESRVTALERLDFTDGELAGIDGYAVEGGIDLWRTSSSS